MIEQLLDLTNYATYTRVACRKTGKKTNEFFTPYSIVKRMCDKIPDEHWRPIKENPKKSNNHQTKQLSHIKQSKC